MSFFLFQWGGGWRGYCYQCPISWDCNHIIWLHGPSSVQISLGQRWYFHQSSSKGGRGQFASCTGKVMISDIWKRYFLWVVAADRILCLNFSIRFISNNCTNIWRSTPKNDTDEQKKRLNPCCANCWEAAWQRHETTQGAILFSEASQDWHTSYQMDCK